MAMYGVLYTALSPSITNMSKQNNHNMSSFFKLQFCDRVVFGVPRFLGCIHLYNDLAIAIVLDTGATVNLINEILAKRLTLNITPASQSATQADGISDLEVVGETRFTVQRGNIRLYFEGLVVRGLETGILAGVPFMEENDVWVRPKLRKLALGKSKLSIRLSVLL